MTKTTEQLLSELQWPTAHMEDKGRVTWNRAATDDTLDVALLLVSPSRISARFTKYPLTPSEPTIFEAVWAISPSEPPSLTSLTYVDEPQPLDESQAISKFTAMLELLNAKPAFQTMGTRWKAARSPTPGSRN